MAKSRQSQRRHPRWRDYLVVMGIEGRRKLSNLMSDSQTMLEARVIGSRINIVDNPQLPNPTKALNERAIKDHCFVRLERDCSPHRVIELFRRVRRGIGVLAVEVAPQDALSVCLYPALVRVQRRGWIALAVHALSERGVSVHKDIG